MSAVYIGEVPLAWKDMTGQPMKWKYAASQLIDPESRCQKPVQGKVNIGIRWIPCGEKGSNYDVEGNKKGADQAHGKGGEKAEIGAVEVYPFIYTHPIDTPVSDYVLEMKIGDQVINSKTIPKEDDQILKIHDIRLIPVFDLQQASILTMNLKMVQGDTIASAKVELGQYYAAPAKFVNAKHDVEFVLSDTLKSKERGKLNLKMRFLLKKPKDFDEKKKEALDKKQSPERKNQREEEEEKKNVPLSQKLPKKQTRAEDDFE